MYEFIRPFLEIFLLFFEIIIITLTICLKNRLIKFLFAFINLFLAIILYQNAVKLAYCCGGLMILSFGFTPLSFCSFLSFK